MWAILISCVLIVATIYFLFLTGTNTKGKLPAGPRGLPIFGNILQLYRSKTPWVDFEIWKDEYGPLFYLNVLGQPFVIINTAKVAADLLSRGAHKYSDRPRNILGSEILAGGLHLALAKQGETWRRQRRAAHEGLHKDAMHVFDSAQTLEALILADNLLRDADSWEDHIQKSTVSMIMSITYNLPSIKSMDDPGILRIKAHIERILYAVHPGNSLLDLIPWLMYVPAWASKWKREAQDVFKNDSEFFVNLYREAVARFSKDEQPSFVAYMARQSRRHGLSEVEAAWTAANMYGAGAETTTTALNWFMFAMVHHPEIQKKAHAELDSVVGRSRPPTFADHDHLPYIRAIVKEILRWRPPLPLGVPHRLIEDDWYEDYFLPKGTLCITNLWAINRDMDLYGPDAHDFNPDRHLDEHGQLLPALRDFNQQDERHSTYGFGRRDCVGRYVANASLFIDLATILWATNIQPIVDDQGRTLVPDVNSHADLGSAGLHPPPFKPAITARFPETMFLLQESLSLS